MNDEAYRRWGGFDGIELLAFENALRVTVERDRDLVAMRLLPELREFMCPSPPTPEERADALVKSFFRDYKGFDEVPAWVSHRLAQEIAAAIKSDRIALEAAKDGTS